MKSKKVNTVPNGVGIIVVICLEILLILLIGLFLLPKIESVGIFCFAIVAGVALIHYISLKHWNFIEISTDGVFHQKENYTWKDVFITVKCSNPNFARNSFDYYAFFDNHFLTNEEVESKWIKRKGFYIILTSKRIELLLQNYQKEIKVLNVSMYRGNEDITNQIKQHNEKFTKY